MGDDYHERRRVISTLDRMVVLENIADSFQELVVEVKGVRKELKELKEEILDQAKT